MSATHADFRNLFTTPVGTKPSEKAKEAKVLLGKFTPSKAFIEVFGEMPTRALPGESYVDLKGKQTEYLQKVSNLDPIKPTPISDSEQLLAATCSDFFLNDPYFFQDKLGRKLVTFPSVPGMETWEHEEIAGDYIILWAQLRMLKAGILIPHEQLYPHPALFRRHSLLQEEMEGE